MSLPAFGRGVELIASRCASTPLVAVRWDRATRVDVELDEQPTILTQPDPMTTAWHWRFAAVKDLIEAGNHVALLGDVDWRTGRPGWVVPLPVEHVGLVTDPSRPGWWAFTLGGWVLDREDVLHISAGNRSGEVLGQGVIDQYRWRLGEQLTAEQWAGKYLHGGGLPPAVITAPQVVTDEQVVEFRDRWRGMVETGEATIIPNGAQVVPLQSDAQRQQLVEARQWNALTAAIILGVPPHKLGLPSAGPMPYTNMQEADIQFDRDVLARWLDPVCATLSQWLLPLGVSARADFTSRLRTDTRTQAEVATMLSGGAVLTRDEARQMYGRGPWPEPDPVPVAPVVPVVAGQDPAVLLSNGEEVPA